MDLLKNEMYFTECPFRNRLILITILFGWKPNASEFFEIFSEQVNIYDFNQVGTIRTRTSKSIHVVSRK